jgi:hypothetical protein
MSSPDNLALVLKRIEQTSHAREALAAAIDRLVMEGATLDVIEEAFDEAIAQLTGDSDQLVVI